MPIPYGLKAHDSAKGLRHSLESAQPKKTFQPLPMCSQKTSITFTALLQSSAESWTTDVAQPEPNLQKLQLACPECYNA